MSPRTSDSTSRKTTSQLSYFLSSLCLLHCLMMPFVIIIIPAFSSIFSDTVENILLLSIVPISIYAFLPTWLKHKNVSLALAFLSGLLMILVAQYGIEHTHYTSLEQLWSGTFSNVAFAGRIVLLTSGVILLAFAVYKNNKHTHVCHNPHHHH
jgi:uncharacterized membrane protein YfcA